MSVINFFHSSNKWERILSILEIKLNLLLFGAKPSKALYLDEMLLTLNVRPELRDFLQDVGTEKSVEHIRRQFDTQIAALNQQVPFPLFYNADKSFALLVFAITRYLCPDQVVETGVGYGIISALILEALRKNGKGRLKSIDLHPLSDPGGSFVGIGIPQDLRKEWTLISGSSRRWLPKIVREYGFIDLFVSDSANVFTLQKYEFNCVLPHLSSNGAIILNNISLRFQEYLKTIKEIEYYTVWQSEKFPCATAIVFKTVDRS